MKRENRWDLGVGSSARVVRLSVDYWQSLMWSCSTWVIFAMLLCASKECSSYCIFIWVFQTRNRLSWCQEASNSTVVEETAILLHKSICLRHVRSARGQAVSSARQICVNNKFKLAFALIAIRICDLAILVETCQVIEGASSIISKAGSAEVPLWSSLILKLLGSTDP